MLRKSSTAFAAVVTLLMGLLVNAQPAGAALNNCPYYSACVWKDLHYVTGSNDPFTHNLSFELRIPQFSQWNYSGTSTSAQDNASSAFNNGCCGERAYFFKDHCCLNSVSGTSAFSIAPGTGDSDFTNGSPAGDLDNELSSGAFASQIDECRAAG
jgi:hypothetical protein